VFLFKFKTPEIRARHDGAPSPLLAYLAGAFAPRIAGLWPAPHAPFLSAPSARRHLLCLAFSDEAMAERVDPDALLRSPLKHAIPLATPRAPIGLSRALDRLGERAWSAEDYRCLLHLLAGHHSGKVLRHREAITAEDVRALSRLPQPLLEAGLGRLPLGAAAGDIIGEVFAAIVRRDGEAAALALAPRWAHAETVKVLIARLREDVEPQPPAPPFPGSERLRPLATKAAILDARDRFKNCLGHRLHWACAGSSALYEWIPSPGVVLELIKDNLHGWSLDQARLVGNQPVPEPTRSQLIAELTAMGVHVGRGYWRLDDAFDEIETDPPGAVTPLDRAIGHLFGD
jgi:hypothetical protein